MPKKAKAPKEKKPRQLASRFGIGEWFGKSFDDLTPQERKALVEPAKRKVSKKDPTRPECPFRSAPELKVPCSKKGGVCSIRLYRKDTATGITDVVPEGTLRAICPHRLKDGNHIYTAIAKTLIGTEEPIILGEVPFLQTPKKPKMAAGKQAAGAVAANDQDDEKLKDVGSIDNVLVDPKNTSNWCAVELQAVYFQGENMPQEFDAIAVHEGPGLPFPVKSRRPDYRSSGPKRLMPQLQIKVPTLRPWGKKMAVVVDEDFFDAMGQMEEIKSGDLTSSEIVWFIVRYVKKDGKYQAEHKATKLTNLDEAVKGLIGGYPVSQATFHKKIEEKIAELKKKKEKLARN